MKSNKFGTMIILGIIAGAIIGLIVQNFFLWLIIGAAVGVIVGIIWKSPNKNSQAM
jgi:uncharacterized membrane protein